MPTRGKRTRSKTLNPEVFLCAAEILCDESFGFGCCEAIDNAVEEIYVLEPLQTAFHIMSRKHITYLKLMIGHLISSNDSYYYNWGKWWVPEGREFGSVGMEARVTALLICYWELKGV